MQFILPALGVLFIGLKLAEVITWSWWLVLLPLYGAAILALVAFAAGMFIFARSIK